MVVLIVVLTIVVFIIVDFALRTMMKKIQELKLNKERKEALDIGLKLDFTDEAKTLKRIEVKNPKARILAVDDETIVLDSFRKILVLAGYSVDTVESGKEALGLIQKEDYDFVFTDLKMPEMDGVDVTKAVKHLRPDIDVIVITGYASIETAVETMKFGAMDYIQKPFTEDELTEFINKSLIRRNDRVEKQMKPKVRLVNQFTKESSLKHEINVPAGLFIARNHTWVKIEMNGIVKVGLDDLIRKTVGEIVEVQLPKINEVIRKNDKLFQIKSNSYSFEIHSPISGKVSLLNTDMIEHPEWISIRPLELSWLCCIEPENLSAELPSLSIGKETINWYEQEIEKYKEIVKAFESQIVDNDVNGKAVKEKIWKEFSKIFLCN